MGARCAFQFYPDNPDQVDMITKAALDSGFTGGLVVDYPNSTKAKKYEINVILDIIFFFKQDTQKIH